MTMTAGGVAKLIEECGELQQVLGKLLAWYRTDEPHWDGSDLRQRLEDEIGDVYAAMRFVIGEHDLDWGRIVSRCVRKLALFNEWHADPTNNQHGVDAHAATADDFTSAR